MRRVIEKAQAYQCTDPNAALLSLSNACAEIQQGLSPVLWASFTVQSGFASSVITREQASGVMCRTLSVDFPFGLILPQAYWGFMSKQ